MEQIWMWLQKSHTWASLWPNGLNISGPIAMEKLCCMRSCLVSSLPPTGCKCSKDPVKYNTNKQTKVFVVVVYLDTALSLWVSRSQNLPGTHRWSCRMCSCTSAALDTHQHLADTRLHLQQNTYMCPTPATHLANFIAQQSKLLVHTIQPTLTFLKHTHTHTQHLKDDVLKCFLSSLKTIITFKKTCVAEMTTLTLQPPLCTEAFKGALLLKNKQWPTCTNVLLRMLSPQEVFLSGLLRISKLLNKSLKSSEVSCDPIRHTQRQHMYYF